MALTDLWFCLIGLGAGSGLQGVVTRFAARRVLVQPAGVDLAAERTVLAAVLSKPSYYALVDVLDDDDFYLGEHRKVWRRIVRAGTEGTADFSYCSDEVKALVARLVEMGSRNDVSARQLIRAGYRIVDAAADRGRLAGTGRIEESDDEDAPRRRVYEAPPRPARVVSALAVAVGFGGGAYFVGSLGLAVAPSVVLTLALWIMATAAVVLSLVDLATFYLDTTTFWWAVGISWALAALGLFAAGDASHLWRGLATVVTGVVLFEVPNRLYTLLRGQAGMGFGDSLLLLLTAGLPAAITGSWVLGVYCIIFSLLVGLLGAGVRWVRGLLGKGPRMTRRTPYAFGPYLAGGWVVAWSWALLAHVPGVRG